MKALVVYESMYGNTAAVGDAIAASLRAHATAWGSDVAEQATGSSAR
jgi:flavodoxin